MPTGAEAIAVGEKLWQQLIPEQQEGQLSFWEMYATRALVERFPGIGIEGHEVDLPKAVAASPEQVGIAIDTIGEHSPLAAIDVRPGDVLIEFGGEPFYRDHGGIPGLDAWLLRELRAKPATYSLRITRGNELLDLDLPLNLGSYQAR